MKIKLLTLVVLIILATLLFKIQTHYNIQKEKQKLADIEYDNSLKMLIAEADRAKQMQYEEEQRQVEEERITREQVTQEEYMRRMIALQILSARQQSFNNNMNALSNFNNDMREISYKIRQNRQPVYYNTQIVGPTTTRCRPTGSGGFDCTTN